MEALLYCRISRYSVHCVSPPAAANPARFEAREARGRSTLLCVLFLSFSVLEQGFIITGTVPHGSWMRVSTTIVRRIGIIGSLLSG